MGYNGAELRIVPLEYAMTDLNPQAKQMADESMVRNLDAQARAIWPQEISLLRRFGLVFSAPFKTNSALLVGQRAEDRGQDLRIVALDVRVERPGQS